MRAVVQVKAAAPAASAAAHSFLYEAQRQVSESAPPLTNPRCSHRRALAVLNEGPASRSLQYPTLQKSNVATSSHIENQNNASLVVTYHASQSNSVPSAVGQTGCIHALHILQSMVQQAVLPQSVSVIVQQAVPDGPGGSHCRQQNGAAIVGAVRAAAVEYPSIGWQSTEAHAASSMLPDAEV